MLPKNTAPRGAGFILTFESKWRRHEEVFRRFPVLLGVIDHLRRRREDGFALHALRMVAPNGSTGLEQLCQYGLRAPFTLDRISIAKNGTVLYQMHRPWPKPDSTRFQLTFEPVAFLGRLAALVPSPARTLCATTASLPTAPACGAPAGASWAKEEPVSPMLVSVPETPQPEKTPDSPAAPAPPPKLPHCPMLKDEFSFLDTNFAGVEFDEPVCKTPRLATTPHPGRGPL